MEFMLGLCALVGGTFATSNRESGDGRYDIQLKPLSKGLPGILIELKAGKDCTEKQLKQLSETALRQINENKYDIDLKAAGIDHIYKYWSCILWQERGNSCRAVKKYS